MYFLKKRILRLVFRWMKWKPTDMPMVKYWITSDHQEARVTRARDGSYIMHIKGEDQPFPGFPRGYLLFGTLSKLKHEIKVQLFNDSWWKLEGGISRKQVIQEFKDSLDKIALITEEARYEILPPSRMPPAVREIWRAMSTLEKRSSKIKPIKDALTYVLTEDDGYRFRLQWLIQIFNPSAWWFRFLFRDPVKDFDVALQELEHAEVVGDMKERVRLFRRIVLLILQDEKIRECFEALCKEMNWNKLKLSKADKYHFRGKYFKVDFDRFEY